MTPMELLLLINNNQCRLYYDPFEHCFTYETVNQKEIDRVLAYKKREEIKLSDIVSNIMLPTYEEIDHEEIMRYFVKECVEDKEIKKTLFYILRRKNYFTPFIDKLKELDLL